MKFIKKDPTRSFESFSADGLEKTIIQDCGEISLNPDELITVRTGSTYVYDIVCKDFGFYASPSDKRLAVAGLRAAIVRNLEGKNYVLIVKNDKHQQFSDYLDRQAMELVQWLDSCAPSDGIAPA